MGGACPNIVEKTFVDGSQTAKFVNVFFLKSFPLCGNMCMTSQYFTVCISYTCTELLSQMTTLVCWRRSLVFSTLAPVTTSSWCLVSAIAVELLLFPQAQDQLSSKTSKSQQFLSSIKAPLISFCWLQGSISRVGLLPCFEKGSEK